jgi:glycosyltransferase involved in cell wall biosynthesis
MKTSVIIATFRRAKLLEICLNSLLRQTRLPDEIILITHEHDAETASLIQKITQSSGNNCGIRVVTTPEENIVRAENTGLTAASGEIICFIDDDATAPESWLHDIMHHYATHPWVGGVGGPVIDIVGGKPLIEYTRVFARVNWFGRRITNSTKIPPCLMTTDLLRGANMSFRKILLRPFDENLLPYWRRFEDDACAYVKKQGYSLICDPRLAVLHAEKKLPSDTQVDHTPKTIFGLHHNSMYVKLKHCRVIFKPLAFLYEIVWGDDKAPGALPLLAIALNYRQGIRFIMLWHALRGKCKGAWTYIRFLATNQGS